MVAPLVAGGLAASSKLLPLAGKALTYLPAIGAGVGAISQADRGLGGMVQGAGLGALTTMGLGGTAGRFMRPLAGRSALLARGLGASPAVSRAAYGLGAAAVPIGLGVGGGLLGAGISGPLAGGAGNVAQGAMALGSQQGNYPMPGNPNTTNVSGQHGGMMQMPDGSIWQQINPGGYQQGLRFGSGLDTDQNISNQNKWFQSQLPQWDEIERRKQSRAIQNAQISSNIALARQLAGNRQIADLNIAQDQARSMGSRFANTAVPTLAM